MGPGGGPCGWKVRSGAGPATERPQVRTPPRRPRPASSLRSLAPSHKSVPMTALKQSLTELAQPQKVAAVASVVLGHTVPLSSGQTLDPSPERVRGGRALRGAPRPCSSRSWGDGGSVTAEGRGRPCPLEPSAQVEAKARLPGTGASALPALPCAGAIPGGGGTPRPPPALFQKCRCTAPGPGLRHQHPPPRGQGQRQPQRPLPLSGRRFLFAQGHPLPQGSPLRGFPCLHPLPVLAPEAGTQGGCKQARPGHRVSAGRPTCPPHPGPQWTTSRPGLPAQHGPLALSASPPSPAPSVPLYPA